MTTTINTFLAYGFSREEAKFLESQCEWDFEDSGWLDAAREMLEGVAL